MKLKIILTTILFCGFFGLVHSASAKTFYLDGDLSFNCSGNYSIANKNCSGSDGDAYVSLADAETALQGSDTLYIRSGTYSHATTNSNTAGILDITKAGSAGNPTIVSGYPGEQPVICAYQGHCNYNPNPADNSVTPCTPGTSAGGAACYYPNPAVSIQNSYVKLINIKTYGQVVLPYINGKHDITIEQCDIGGAGPFLNQGQALAIDGYDSSPGAYNITVQNNKIHHSAWGEAILNSSTLMTYATGDLIIENNEFSDGYGPDVRIKDGNYQGGTKSVTIRNNFFKPSTISPGNSGVSGVGQWDQLYMVYVHNNIFFGKNIAGGHDTSNIMYYNNTFIDNDYDLYSWAAGLTLSSYNNLHYHSNSSKYYIYHENQSPTTVLISDYNLFYQTGTGNKWKNGATSTTSFSAWQGAGYDANSINSSDPNFVNASGNFNIPTDFKRNSYTENFIGSSYGNHAGAYETGNETIGVDWTTPADVTPPASPTGLSVS